MTSIPFPTNPTVNDLHQPNPPAGPVYVYRGADRWDLAIATTNFDLANYYTRAEVNALQSAQDVSIATATSAATAAGTAAAAAQTTASAAIPATQKAAANGVATLDSGGKVPSGQLTIPAAAWADVTGKPSTFTPASHTHAIADITGLQTALDAKATALGFTPANLAGDTFTGAITAPAANINGASGTARSLSFKTGGSLRWNISAGTEVETLSNAGSNLHVDAYTDGGSFLGRPFSITRSTLVVNFSNWPTVNGAAVPRTVNGIAPDGAGNVALGYEQVRLGTRAYTAVGSNADVEAAYAHVVTGISRDTGTAAVTGIYARPLQQLYGSIWYTIAQI